MNTHMHDDAHQDDVVLEPDMENADAPEGKKKSSFRQRTSDESGEQQLIDEIAALKEKIKTLTAEKQETMTSWQRAQAEFMNIRKRDEEEKREFSKYAAEKIIADILPAVESFNLAKSQKEKWEHIDPQWRNGMESIYTQLTQALKKHGVEEVDPKGQSFDPYQHEAISQVPVSDASQDGVIQNVVQKGYTLHGKVIKVPKVIVGIFEEK